MHRLATIPGETNSEDITLVEQRPAPVRFLTSATTDIGTLSKTLDLDSHKNWKNKIRALPLSSLSHPAQIDYYLEYTATNSVVEVVRFLGSKSQWSYGFEKLQIWQSAKEIRNLIVLSGTKETSLELNSIGNIELEIVERCSDLLTIGGIENMSNLILEGKVKDRNNHLIEGTIEVNNNRVIH